MQYYSHMHVWSIHLDLGVSRPDRRTTNQRNCLTSIHSPPDSKLQSVIHRSPPPRTNIGGLSDGFPSLKHELPNLTNDIGTLTRFRKIKFKSSDISTISSKFLTRPSEIQWNSAKSASILATFCRIRWPPAKSCDLHH